MNKDPKYRRLRQKGRPDRAFVELGGKRIYLGRYGTDESQEAYHRRRAEWRGNGQRLPTEPKTSAITVVELIDRFWTYAVEHYRKAGDSTRILQAAHLDALRKCLAKIRGKFAKLYKTDSEDCDFAMEIEFKVTRENALIIKQAPVDLPPEGAGTVRNTAEFPSTESP